ncbi:hypothetical protein HRR83_004440 [Exophiala dermatitidis]|nr:hypothetical protein HRR83_004440 [Exophiala dermatitidis]
MHKGRQVLAIVLQGLIKVRRENTKVSCIAYKDECHYDKPPSLAYVRSLEEEIQELKAQLRETKNQIWLSRVPQDDNKQLSTSPASDAAISQGLSQHAHRSRQVKWETDIITLLLRSTNLPPPSTSPLHRRGLKVVEVLIEPFAVANGAARVNVPKEVAHELLKYHWCWVHPLFLFVYRPAFTGGMAMLDLSGHKVHDPPYFSETLLKAIHAHSSRFLNHDVYQIQYQNAPGRHNQAGASLTAAEFMRKISDEARSSLAMDILKRSSIPTIQALLQQSAREVVFRRSSQAWTLSGVAFRMAFDLGIHLPSDKLQSFVKSLTAEDVEVRTRLFWSCYTWDKILSLYLGRMPGFTPNTDEVPPNFMDDYSDSDLWAPYYGETPSPEVANTPDYPPCPGYVVSCFRPLCKICVILNDLMQNIYRPSAAAGRDAEEEDQLAEAKANSETSFIRISRNLRDWLMSLPPHLRINPSQMPSQAPPAHIMSLNLLYHTTVILLHRPVVLGASNINSPGPARSYRICIQAMEAIHNLIMLQAKTFGLAHVSYLNAYSVYIAATIAVSRLELEPHLVEEHAPAAREDTLNFFLRVLHQTSKAMPALERSYAIISKRVRAVLDRHHLYNVGSDYSNGSTPPRFSMLPTTTTQQMDTAFQTLSNPGVMSDAYPQTDTPGSLAAAPMAWPPGMQNSLYPDAMHAMDDFLPAFPGQQFPVGSEHSFGSSDVDPQARTALMAYNLDPHPRLNSGDLDWNIMDAFETNSIHV